MRILIACEYSGRVRAAFRSLGHDAWSADLPAEDNGPHIQVTLPRCSASLGTWSLRTPPCTYLCNSGVRWLYHNGARVRRKAMREAAAFFRLCLEANAPRACVENPVPHRHAELPPASQYVQPWQFGDPESKRTGLWLRGLPPLVPTHSKPAVIGHSVHRASPGPDRWRERSRTFPGIAAAMAAQWS